MGAVYFYQLRDSPLEATLPMLLGKTQEAGWRTLVRGTDDGAMKRLDDVLWGGPEGAFLPHGLAGGAHDLDQPILLGVDQSADGFDCIMSVSGAHVSAAEIGLAERTCVLFDGHDEGALQFARGQWKTLTDAGCSAQYWAQDDGRWIKKAESGV